MSTKKVLNYGNNQFQQKNLNSISKMIHKKHDYQRNCLVNFVHSTTQNHHSLEWNLEIRYFIFATSVPLLLVKKLIYFCVCNSLARKTFIRGKILENSLDLCIFYNAAKMISINIDLNVQFIYVCLFVCLLLQRIHLYGTFYG